jgi:hypothetical protein
LIPTTSKKTKLWTTHCMPYGRCGTAPFRKQTLLSSCLLVPRPGSTASSRHFLSECSSSSWGNAVLLAFVGRLRVQETKKVELPSNGKQTDNAGSIRATSIHEHESETQV